MSSHEHHEHHHDLIAQRSAQWRNAPRRSGLDRLRRRESYKRVVTTLRGHLSCCHEYRHPIGPMPEYDELVALHDAYHSGA